MTEITDEQFDNALEQILDEHTGAQLLTIPGAYEVFSEHFNNEAIDRATGETGEEDTRRLSI